MSVFIAYDFFLIRRKKKFYKMAQMLKPVYLKNSELPSENDERITNFELL